jgi:hypothetical protein
MKEACERGKIKPAISFPDQFRIDKDTMVVVIGRFDEKLRDLATGPALQ